MDPWPLEAPEVSPLTADLLTTLTSCQKMQQFLFFGIEGLVRGHMAKQKAREIQRPGWLFM
jgi:hypothetical protein